MVGRRTALYFAWSRPDEIAAPLGVLNDRFPALFELRRITWPRFEHLADPARFDQGVGGFLDHVQLENFRLFADLTASWTGAAVRMVERRTSENFRPLDETFLSDVDTLIVISFDSARAGQRASDAEIGAMRAFLDDPDHVVFLCPHHDIGDTAALPEPGHLARQEVEFRHHGDPAIPAKQGFGDFALSLLSGLGAPVRNRFGLRPAKLADGSPVPLEIFRDLDRAGMLAGVTRFNLHPHLPHLERQGEGLEKLDVLARQLIDPDAPRHPFTQDGADRFDALLQSRPGVFAGRLLVCDTTLWSSSAGGGEDIQRFWRNVATA